MAVVVAGLCVLAWLVAVCRVNPGLIADEQYHYLTSAAMARGEMPDSQTLGMPPTFHTAAAAVLRTFGMQLWVLRAFNALLFVGAIVCFAAAAVRLRAREAIEQDARREGSGTAGPVWLTLLFALNPLIFPYGALAYTEPASLLAVMAAFWLLVIRKPMVCAAVLVAACLIRQSNLAWLPMFAIWWMCDRPGRENDAEARRDWGGWGLIPLLLAIPAAWLGLQALGGVEFGGRGANAPQFNRAQFYVFPLAIGALWLPLWVARFPGLWRSTLQWLTMRARFVAVGLAAVGALVMVYQNPHPWNADPRYVRNQPLIAMDWSDGARYLVSAVVVATEVMLALVLRGQRFRWPAILALGSSIVFLAPHYLVDPRYYQIPFALMSLTIRFKTGEAAALVAWQVVVCVAICAYIAQTGDPSGGIW